ncbi:hypothetical protein D9M68_967850 [compost metagenome]
MPSGEMPMPLSFTLTMVMSAWVSAVISMRGARPGGMNFSALVTRFWNSWESRLA